MKEIDQISKQLSYFASQYGPSAVVTATVKAVNADDTVSVEFAEGGTIDDCRLKSIVKDGNKVITIPAVGSEVLAGRIDNSDEFVVLAVHEITDIVEIIGDTRYSHNANGFLLAKGNDHLLKVFQLIIEAVMQIVVIQGTNPDRMKLQQALTAAQNILRNGT